jgi:hypothetical protein
LGSLTRQGCRTVRVHRSRSTAVAPFADPGRRTAWPPFACSGPSNLTDSVRLRRCCSCWAPMQGCRAGRAATDRARHHRPMPSNGRWWGTMQQTRDVPRSHGCTGRRDRRELVLRPWIDRAYCHCLVGGRFVGTTERLRKLCGDCGAVPTNDLPRCPATNKRSNRQCRLPMRADPGSSTGQAHQGQQGVSDAAR